MNASAEFDARVEAFEAAWRQQPAPALESFLPPRSPHTAFRLALLQELIKIDLEYRWCRATGVERWRLETYAQRFPELGAAPHLPAALIREEYTVRLWSGEAPAWEEYIRRFGRREEIRGLLAEVDRERAEEEASAERFHQAHAETVPTAQPLLASGAELADVLRRHGLLTAKALQSLDSLVRQFPDARRLAEHLLAQGLLTPFQVNLLLRGRGADLILGPYVLLDRLGQGAMGRVYRAVHRHLARAVAVKVIRPDLLKNWDPESLSRFYQEMQAVGRLSHPNVVHAYDAGPLGATYFLAMEYVPGTDLYKLVKAQGPRPPAQAADFIRQAALGLQHAHERGLVHRDVKPANILVTTTATPGYPFGQARILDLGLARLRLAEQVKSSSGLTRSGSVLGTVDYMAPEQAENPHLADIRADVYSLGCTLYFLLTGQPPFAEGTFLQKLNRHKSEPPTMPASIPLPLADALRRMLAKQPEERFQTPAEVAAALGGSVRRRGPIPALSRRWLILGGAALAVVPVTIAVPFLLRNRRSSGEPMPTPTEPPEPAGRRVLWFDGVDDFVALPDGIIPEAAPVTAEAWFRTTRGGVILGHQNAPYPDNKDEDHFAILYVGTDGSLRGGFWTGYLGIAGKVAVNDGRWHHAAAVMDGTMVRLYLDGAEIASQAGSMHPHRMVKTQIGICCTRNWAAVSVGDWYAFAGEIKDVRLWTSARTPAQLRQTMNFRLRGNEPGLAAWYPLDEASGDRVLDQSSHRQHGVLGAGRAAWKPKRVAEGK
jgi:serine/threonine-protein kinase